MTIIMIVNMISVDFIALVRTDDECHVFSYITRI